MSDPRAERAKRPAICLNMIVRNEAHIVAEALDSVAPYISSWVIVDTGSDDGTQALIRDHMDRLGVPGELYERPWRNFGDNRTEALTLAQGQGDYVWVVDADDLLVGKPDFAGLGADVYWVRYVCNAHGYYRSQLFRDGVRVQWVGVTHEAPMWDFACCVEARLEGDYHIEDRQRGARNLSGQKYARDRDLLLAEVERNPANARSIFYLAQSYYDLGDFANARKWYARRAEMGGWEEETYYAMWRVAVSMGQLNEPWPDVRNAYLRAWKFRPTRAEPLFAIAARYRADGCYQLGYEFAKRAADIPFPEQDMLFVRTDIYNWRIADEQAVCASWIGKHAEAFTLWRRLLTRSDLPENERQRIAENRDVCAPTMIEAASAYPDPELLASVPRHGRHNSGVVVSLVAGPDLAATQQTLDSFLRCCNDVSRAGRFLVVDAGLSGPDREILCQRYEFLDVVHIGAQLGQIRAQIHARFWLHLGQGWRFFAPENLITRLTAVLEAEPQVYQVGINLGDAVKLTGVSAPEQAVRRTPEGGRYLLTDEIATGPAMFDTERLDRPGGSTASLDEVLCIAGDSSDAALYTPAFYDGQAAGSSASAAVMVPMLAELTRPNSVLDVGCGVGGWVASWLDSGADAIGVDGDHVPRAQLCIPADRFIDYDLTTRLDLGRRFDLVICLEVAEHLPPEAAETLVDSLCRHGDVIVFSAAIPGQGGTGHINERWPSFWAALFAAHGYRPYDLLRGRLWWDTRCEWWYRQNVLVYATDDVAHGHGWPDMTGPLDMVHPELFALRGGG
ncbi:glycosyltransferase [Mycobacterium attenuatum]|uniref:glycosyltransferase n=1 Tax=Mycobacterium attenuatum TaxID=2341086 RepID=UPI000F028303|nr:glycosyltransferase [Mycobacterium attenuatum]